MFIMKRPIFTALTILFSMSLFAQEKIDVGINFNYGIPLGNQYFGTSTAETNPSMYLGNGTGGSIEGNYWFSERFSAGLEAGYLMFAEYDNVIDEQIVKSSASAVPIVAKATVYLSSGRVKPYLELGAGYMLMNHKQTAAIDLGTEVITQELTWDQSGPVISPRFGFQFVISKMIAINLNGQYNYAFNKIDGTHSFTLKTTGLDDVTMDVENALSDATQFVTVNLGVKIALFDYFDVF